MSSTRKGDDTEVTPKPEARGSNRSTPPPIPASARTQTLRSTVPPIPGGAEVAALAVGMPAMPTVLDELLTHSPDTMLRTRATHLSRELEAKPTSANLAIPWFELGELEERLGEPTRAIAAFRHAAAADPSFRAATWALRRFYYRKGQWNEIAELVDQELASAGQGERVELSLERALLLERKNERNAVRGLLDKALRIAPTHTGVLFEIERAAAAGGDQTALIGIWEALAEVTAQPERKIAYWIEVARATAPSDFPRARRALDAIARADGVSVRVARERLRLADTFGERADITSALDALAEPLRASLKDLEDSRRPEAIVLLRRLARRSWNSNVDLAWTLIHEAYKLDVDDAIILGDLVELANAAGRYGDLRPLAHLWWEVEDEPARLAAVSAWCAVAYSGGVTQRVLLRPLLGILADVAPGFLLLSAAREYDTLVDLPESREQLASLYLEMARGAETGRWCTIGATPKPSPQAAVSLFVQAAEVSNDGTEATRARVSTMLDAARAIDATHPVIAEAQVDIEETSGRVKEAIARLNALAKTSPDSDHARSSITRGIRIAATHDMTELVLEMLHQLVAVSVDDAWPTWQLEATLAHHHRGRDERGELLASLAKQETGERRIAAMITAARMTGGAAAEELLREAMAATPDPFISEEYVAILRSLGRWDVLAEVRLAEAKTTSDPATKRRAFREAAWVIEVKLGQPERAAQVYETWLADASRDRTALEGLARCRALQNPELEAATRATIAELDANAETSWLYARSLERAGRDAEVITQFRAVLGHAERTIATLSAALAFGDYAGANAETRFEGIDALARRTTDAGLAADLFERCGWIALVELADPERANAALTAASDLEPERLGSQLGVAVTANRDDPRIGDAYCKLAEQLASPRAKVACWLRAAASALAARNVDIANERIGYALAILPDDPTVVIVAAEMLRPIPRDERDPFAFIDRLTQHAELLGRRAALCSDPQARMMWQLDRVDALRQTGDVRAAIPILAEILQVDPQHRRALATVRRIARGVDELVWAHTCYALASLPGDRAIRLRNLRDAVGVYDRSGPKHQVDFAIAAYTRMLELGDIAIAERLQDLLHQRGRRAELVDVLTQRLAATDDVERKLVLLHERARLLCELDRAAAGSADLDAILSHSPKDDDAERLRSGLADVVPREPDIELTWESDSTQRREITDKRAGTADGFPFTTTNVEQIDNDPFSATTVVGDPFGAETPVVDLAALHDQERMLSADRARSIVTVADLPSNVHPSDRPIFVPELARLVEGYGIEPVLDVTQLHFPEQNTDDDNSAAVVLSYDQLRPTAIEGSEETLLLYEQAAVADRASLLHRLEAGRLAEEAGQYDRARGHYEAALLADERAPLALRGLRRIAHDAGKVIDAARLIEPELVGTGEERAALSRYRIDLLLAGGEDDLARVAVGDELDRAPQDEPLLLAALELALRDRRRDELASVLAKLLALDEPALGSALRFVLGVSDDDTSHVARLERIWSSRTDAGARMLELAYHIERDDPLVAAAVAVRASSWLGASREAADLAVRAAPRDPIACRLAAETLLANRDPATAHAFARWARCRSGATERAYAAARAAEVHPALGRLWAQVLDLDHDDDYAAAQLRVLQPERASEVGAHARETQFVSAAWELIRAGRSDAALALFDAPSTSWAVREARAEALARVGQWAECAETFEALAEAPGLLAKNVLLYRAALARTEATRLEADADKLRGLIALALAAWRRVLESDPSSPVADGLSIALATRLDNPSLLDDVLARTVKSERSPWTASSLTLRRARLFLTIDPERAFEIASSASTEIDDPRRCIVMMLAAVAARRFQDVANALEERARQREGTDEAVMSRLRAALFLLGRGDQPKAQAILDALEPIIPDLVRDLVSPERRRPVQTFAGILRDADEAETRGELAVALQRYMTAAALRPGNEHAVLPMIRIAARLRQTAPIVVYAREQLGAADAAAVADAHEWMARIERERGSSAAADDHVERVLAVDPARTDLHVALACKLGREGRFGDLMRLREGQAASAESLPSDYAMLLSEIARLAIRGEQPSNDTFARLLRAPPDRLALMYLEHELVPKQRSQPLATLAQQIAAIFEDAPSRAAYTTRAADLLDTIGMRTETIALCRRALELMPAYSPALIVWQRAALVGEQWRELAMALAMRGGTSRDARGASLYHLAGVVLMDKLGLHEQAANALTRTLELEPTHVDALLRLRLLDERVPGSTTYAQLLAGRVATTTDPAIRLELFRLQAELSRRMGDRDAALRHCRSMLSLAPADVRAHAAISDIASEGSSREQAIAAIEARIAVESDFLILHSLNDRLGRLHAEHDVKAAVAAFQQAAMYRPDDVEAIERLAELAVRAKEWNIARTAIDRLLGQNPSAEKQVRYLRAAAMVQLRGFRDHAKAELHLRRAFELAPADAENMRALVTLRAEAGESSSLRAYLDNTVHAMRTQAGDGTADAYTFGLLASVLALRAQLLGEDAHLAARAAAEAADILGMRNPELLATQPATHFVGARVDESLLAGVGQPRVIELLARMRDPVAKHAADLGVHGVGRRERLKHEHPTATIAIGIAGALGFERLEVYASTRDRYRFVVEPTSTPSLVLGDAIASADLLRVRCAAGSALKIAQLGLAIPSRMSTEELDTLVSAILSLVRPDTTGDETVRTVARGLRKHTNQSQLDAIASIAFDTRIDAEGLAHDIRSITWRAAFLACGSLRATLQLFVDIAGIDLQHGLVHEQGRGLVTYALAT